MRTGITQKVPTGSPFIRIVVAGDTHTSEGGGGNDRLMKMSTDEQPWGSQYIIELDNSDEALITKDYEGNPITLINGYIGETSSTFSPLWVWSQQTISREGKLLLQLNCVDIWAFIAAWYATLSNASYNQQWQTATELDIRYMPDGVTLLSAGAPALYASLLANGNKTILAIIQDLCTGMEVTLAAGDTDSYINTLKPPISVGNGRSGLMQLMDYTKSYLKWTTAGTLIPYQPDLHATVYTFNHLNTFYSEVDEAGVAIPNRVIFWSFNETGTEWIRSQWELGYGVNAASYSKLGRYVDRHYLVSDIDNTNMRSQANLNTYADAALAKIVAELNQGFLVAPMHCSLELFDKVEVKDNRYTSDRTITGYVHRMVREYDRGVYRITIYLGGVAGGYTVPGGQPGSGMTGESPYAPGSIPELTVPPWGEILPKAIQGFQTDVTFTADTNTPQTKVNWTGGTVKFYDETTRTVTAGTTGILADTAIRYIYFDTTDVGNLVLKVTTSYMAAMSETTGLLCLVQKGSVAGISATIIPSYGKQPLITPDVIQMNGFKTWTDPVTGVSYSAVVSTQVQSGYLYISNLTQYQSNAYNPTLKARVFRQTSTPTAENIGDLWIDTDDGNKIYRWSGSTWQLSRDTDIDVAINDAAEALAMANTKSRIFRQASTPTGATAGDVWIHTDDPLGADRPYTYSGTTWIASFTQIDGGHITTGTIDCASVTIQTAGSGDRVVLDSSGIKLYGTSGTACRFYTSTGTQKGSIYAHPTLSSFTIAGLDILHLTSAIGGIYLIPATGVYMDSADFLTLPRVGANPGNKTHGYMVFNSATGYVNCYDTVYGGWWHFDRTGGWA